VAEKHVGTHGDNQQVLKCQVQVQVLKICTRVQVQVPSTTSLHSKNMYT